jgi:hypothetical protein
VKNALSACARPQSTSAPICEQKSSGTCQPTRRG